LGSPVISKKWVAKSVKACVSRARCSALAQASDRPSKVGPAAHFVDEDQTLGRGVAQDIGGLDHLDHEGRAPGREVVGGADAGEDPIDRA
jgi:hypothetical protein